MGACIEILKGRAGKDLIYSYESIPSLVGFYSHEYSVSNIVNKYGLFTVINDNNIESRRSETDFLHILDLTAI